MSILSKLQALLTAANTKTGQSDTTLTDAVQTLVDGYGQGGGDFETGVYIGDGIVHSSFITIPVTKQYSHFVLLIDDLSSKENGDFYGCWGTATIYIGIKSTGAVSAQISSDTRGAYLKLNTSNIQFMPVSNGAYCKMIQDANYRWVAWN